MFKTLKAMFFGKAGSSADRIEPAPEEAAVREVTTPPDAAVREVTTPPDAAVREVTTPPDAAVRKREQSEASTPVAEENKTAYSNDVRAASDKQAEQKKQFQQQPGVRVRDVRVEMLPLQHAGHLYNYATHFGATWFNADNGQLRLQFQFVSLFKDAEVQRVWLAVGHAADKVALAPKRIRSPQIGQKHAAIAWAAQSRYVVDEIVTLPRAFSGALALDLLVEVGGTYRKVGLIRPATPSPGPSPN